MPALRTSALALVALAGCRVHFDPLAADGGDAPVDAPSPPILVPGGTFYRGYDSAADALFPDMSYPATISAFRLDATEVTVGQFRAFVDQGGGTQLSPPMDGAGAHAANPGSGWDAATMNTSLPADAVTLKADAICSNFPMWSDGPGTNESKPMNCVKWTVAMAYCIAQGGYLPTQNELNFAETGGDEQRAYAWSQPPGDTSVDCNHADYTTCGPGPSDVGTKPSGNGRWGHSDLAGNVWEWTLDNSAPFQNPCNDCVELNGNGTRIVRGGGFASDPSNLRAADRYMYFQSAHLDNVGIRCAYPP